MSPRAAERGSSLIEVLVAVMLLGILGSAVLGGFSMALKGDMLHRRSAINSVALANGSHAIVDAPYVRCGGVSDYTPALTSVTPEGSTLTIVKVEHWTLGSNPATFASRACDRALDQGRADGDTGLQRITFSAVTNRGGAIMKRTRFVLKRYGGTYTEPPVDPTPGGAVCTISDPSQVDTTWVDEFAGRKGDNHVSDAAMNILYLAGSRRFSYLRFNIAPGATCDEGGTLPAGIDIKGARLRLYTFNVGGAPGCGVGFCWHALERVRATWSANTLTWNNQPCPTGYGDSCAPGGAAGTLFEHGTDQGTPAFQYVEGPNLLTEVRASYATPATDFGWVIKEACSATYGKACGDINPGFQFRSQLGTANERPALTLVYA